MTFHSDVVGSVNHPLVSRISNKKTESKGGANTPQIPSAGERFEHSEKPPVILTLRDVAGTARAVETGETAADALWGIIRRAWEQGIQVGSVSGIPPATPEK